MLHSIHKTQNYKHTVAEPTIRIYAEITDYRMSVPFARKIVFVKSRHELGKNNIPNLKTKPLNYCLFSDCSQLYHQYQLTFWLHAVAFQYPV